MKRTVILYIFFTCGQLSGTLAAQAVVFLKRADSCKSNGSHGLAIEYYLRALSENEKQKQFNTGHEFYIFRRLGNCYLDLNNPLLARNYFLRASRQSQFYRGNINEALLYSELAQFYFRTGQADSFLFFTAKVERLANQLKNDSLAYASSQAMAIYLMQKRDFQNAAEKYNYSLSFARKPNLNKQLPEAFNNLGTLYFEQEKFREALSFFDSSYYYARYFNDKQNLWYSLYNLAEAWYALGNFKEAYEWKRKYSELNAQIMSTDNNNRVAEMQARYDLGEKENDLGKIRTANLVLENETDEKTKQVFFVLLMCLLAATAIGSVAVFYRRLVKKNKLIRVQQVEEVKNTETVNELNRKIAYFSSQVNPEIFFRTIAQLKKNCVSEQVPANALAVIKELAGLMRTSLNLSAKDLVPLSEEILLLRKYIALEKLNKTVTPHSEILIEGSDDFDSFETVPILLQPLFQYLLHKKRLAPVDGVLAEFKIGGSGDTRFLECGINVAPGVDEPEIADNFDIERSFTVAQNRIEEEWTKSRHGITPFEETKNKVVIKILLYEMY